MSRPVFLTLWLALPVTAALACTSLNRLLPQVATPTPTPTEEARQGTVTEPSPTATEPRRLELPPSPTPLNLSSEGDVRSILDLTAPDYFDYFDNPRAWFQWDDPKRAGYRVEEGKLLAVDYEPGELNTWWTWVDRQSGNVYAEVTATNGPCIGKDAVGLVIRVDQATAAGGYGLEISCDGEWRFRRHHERDRPTDLAGWAPSDLIFTGPDAANRLGIWAYQNRFVLFLNNEPVAEVFDRRTPLTYGTFALFVRASQTFELTATFDDFAFWHIRAAP